MGQLVKDLKYGKLIERDDQKEKYQSYTITYDNEIMFDTVGYGYDRLEAKANLIGRLERIKHILESDIAEIENL